MKTIRWQIAQFFEKRWWMQYLKNKKPADYLEWKKNYWREFLTDMGLNHLLDISRGGAFILDAGCGPAGIFTVLDNHSVIGLDPLMEAYTQNLVVFNANNYKHAQFLNQTIESFEGQAMFDYVFCLNALNHVSDLNKAVQALLASVKPGGQLIISVDAHRSALLQKIFALLPGDILHPHQHTLQQYENILSDEGISIQHKVLKKRETIFDYYILVAG